MVSWVQLATCWGLAYAYRTSLKKDVSGADGKATDNAATQPPSTAATPIPTTDTPTLVTHTAATSTTMIYTLAKAKDQSMPTSVSPMRKRKSKQEPQKATRAVKKDEDPMHLLQCMASEQELLIQESEEEEAVTSQS